MTYVPMSFFYFWIVNFCYLLLPGCFLHVNVPSAIEGLYGKQNKLKITTAQEGGKN